LGQAFGWHDSIVTVFLDALIDRRRRGRREEGEGYYLKIKRDWEGVGVGVIWLFFSFLIISLEVIIRERKKGG